ncbi:hypothetical protein C7999DRAFT_44989 [Corynascus novoguineensis]|uniref:Uncharacterized protein n=1 Tax=Corynascus novoguineensis TaxID=1126955 RepID=A0AAN7CLT4_9PEZI|nr:hypothetical protein C7999DRAFT_44989 [Corynascus novoguineensis]
MADILRSGYALHGALIGRFVAYFQPVCDFAHAWELFFHDINGVMYMDPEDYLEELSEKIPQLDGVCEEARDIVIGVHTHPEENLNNSKQSDYIAPSKSSASIDDSYHLITCISYCQEHTATAESLNDATWYRSQIIQPQPQRRYMTAYEDEDSDFRAGSRAHTALVADLANAQNTPIAPCRQQEHAQKAPLAPPPPQPTTKLTTPADEDKMYEQFQIDRKTATIKRKEHIAQVVRVTKAAAAALEQRQMTLITMLPQRCGGTKTTRMTGAAIANVDYAVDGSGHLNVAHEVQLARKRAQIADDPRAHGLPSCSWDKSKTRSAPKDGVPMVILTEPEGEMWYLVDSMCYEDEERNKNESD